MKKFPILVASAITVLSLSTQIWAVPPAKCPSVGALKTAGLSFTGKDDQYRLFYAGQINNYDTAQAWGFAVGVPYGSAVSEPDALAKARAALPSLSGNPTPEEYEPGKYACAYNISNGYLAAAVTPLSNMFSSNLMKTMR